MRYIKATLTKEPSFTREILQKLPSPTLLENWPYLRDQGPPSLWQGAVYEGLTHLLDKTLPILRAVESR